MYSPQDIGAEQKIDKEKKEIPDDDTTAEKIVSKRKQLRDSTNISLKIPFRSYVYTYWKKLQRFRLSHQTSLIGELESNAIGVALSITQINKINQLTQVVCYCEHESACKVTNCFWTLDKNGHVHLDQIQDKKIKEIVQRLASSLSTSVEECCIICLLMKHLGGGIYNPAITNRRSHHKAGNSVYLASRSNKSRSKHGTWHVAIHNKSESKDWRKKQ